MRNKAITLVGALLVSVPLLSSAPPVTQDPVAGDPAPKIEEFAGLLNGQAAKMIERLEVRRAIEVYGAVAKELSGTGAGKIAKERLSAIQKDARLRKEVDAAEAYGKLQKSLERLSTSKQRKKLEDFAEKWKGTKAGERASALVRQKR